MRLILLRILIRALLLLLGGLPNEEAALMSNLLATGEEPPAMIGPVVVASKQLGGLGRFATAMRNSKEWELDAAYGHSSFADAGNAIDKGFGKDRSLFLFGATLEQNVWEEGSWRSVHRVPVGDVDLVLFLMVLMIIGGHFHFT